ncbi:2-aminoethylphosphonate ABC transporter permease subunit [Manganibacter manganicus]|uniref:2-aminoethylphosphonate ABC transporter permease subunit n=1 Tax=Manganibacter manganicus TaxID=1873176 RepID=A0A1V8RWU5_9HYPH|nr:2-aminoethylphosphonate ABC transporter permease subunit [Pseudaminobacter manganicus]OQM77625.1 2-aminoethylphosphonate ABC transporter permease subunit [Pseudaminobacter manganicus]
MADAAIAGVPASRPRLDSFWVVPPLLILAALFFYPLSLIVREALGGNEAFTLSHFSEVLSSRRFLDGLYNTIIIATCATAGCIVLGFVLSLVIAFVPFRGAKSVARLIDTFIALPTFLVTLAFTFIYGSAGLLNVSLIRLFGFDLPPVDFLYSQWGVILAETTVYTPFVMRPLLATFSQIDQAQIEVASSLGAKPLRIIRQIILPAALPALVAGGSLCLLLTVNEFGIVLFIGAKDVITLPMLIYSKAIQEFDYTTACVIAVVNVALSLSLYTLYRLIIAHFGGNRAGVV